MEQAGVALPIGTAFTVSGHACATLQPCLPIGFHGMSQCCCSASVERAGAAASCTAAAGDASVDYHRVASAAGAGLLAHPYLPSQAARVHDVLVDIASLPELSTCDFC